MIFLKYNQKKNTFIKNNFDKESFKRIAYYTLIKVFFTMFLFKSLVLKV